MKRECFDSIDNLPMWNWREIYKTGNLAYLYKDGDYKGDDQNNKEIWFKIQDEYLDGFGINSKLKKIITLKKKLVNHLSDFIITRDTHSRMLADMTQLDIDDENNTVKAMNEDDIMIFLEEKLGRELDLKAVSVRKYNNYINYYSKKNG